MIRIQTLAIVAALALFAGSGGAQTPLTVRPDSRVLLLGRSNVHSWSCATSTFQARIQRDADVRPDTGDSPSRPAFRLTVTVPVRSMDCGRARMNEDMFRALKADLYPEIRYVLTSYEMTERLAAADSFTVNSVGDLTVAGRTQRVEILVKGARDQSGFQGDGGVRLLMTDFGIKPPTAFFGAIRTKNALEVRVEMHVSRDDVAVIPR